MHTETGRHPRGFLMTRFTASGIERKRRSMDSRFVFPTRRDSHVPGRAFRGSTVPARLCLLVLSVCVGCSPQTGRVTGTISLGEKPLSFGRVTFLCDGGKRPAISGDILRGGSYEIANIPPGRVRIAVETFKPDPEPPAGIDPATGVDSALSKMDPGAYVPIPSRYASPNASGLEFVVKAGEQTFNITLTKP